MVLMYLSSYFSFHSSIFSFHSSISADGAVAAEHQPDLLLYVQWIGASAV
jgi:hypothetical protein